MIRLKGAPFFQHKNIELTTEKLLTFILFALKFSSFVSKIEKWNFHKF